jgi:hypothetical protein
VIEANKIDTTSGFATPLSIQAVPALLIVCPSSAGDDMIIRCCNSSDGWLPLVDLLAITECKIAPICRSTSDHRPRLYEPQAALTVELAVSYSSMVFSPRAGIPTV